ncbi:MAG: hypothetical protein Kow0013_11370 [Pararhodobacter sp.]
MTDHRKTDPLWDDEALDALFDAARAEPPAPLPDAFAARLMEGALVELPPARPGGLRVWLARLGATLSEIGGAPGVAGVGAAGLAGVWIGFSGPGLTGDILDRFWQGAATVSPTISTWVDGDLVTDETTQLLSLMSGTTE